MRSLADIGAATAIGPARRAVRDRLAAAGLAEPDADARALVALATGLDAAALIARIDAPLGAQAAGRLAALLARRLDREPVARLAGEREFWGLAFALSPATLVPRPETETVVEAALAAAPAPRRILDLGTGTGAILAALLVERPGATGVAVDRSVAALVTARANLARHGLASRASWVCGDWASALAGAFDLVVSNPPYVRTGQVAALEPEVAHHEPAAALDGGADGLDAYRAIAADLPRLLAPGGIAVLELGDGQADAVAQLMADAGLAAWRIASDLAGRPRALVLRRMVDRP